MMTMDKKKKAILIITMLLIIVLIAFGINFLFQVGYYVDITPEWNPIVYVTNNSSKYHLSGCDELRGRPYRTSLETARSHGYGACKCCHPYQKQIYNYEIYGGSVIVVMLIIIPVSIIIVVIFYKYSKKNKFNNIDKDYNPYRE